MDEEGERRLESDKLSICYGCAISQFVFLAVVFL